MLDCKLPAGKISFTVYKLEVFVFDEDDDWDVFTGLPVTPSKSFKRIAMIRFLISRGLNCFLISTNNSRKTIKAREWDKPWIQQ